MITTNRARSILISSLLALACDGGSKDEGATKTAKADKDGKAEKGDKKDKKDKKKVGGKDEHADHEGDEGAPDGSTPEGETDVDPRVSKAVAVAKAIEASPDKADEILAEHKLDRDALDGLMYEIARDPALASAYQAARSG